VCPGYWGHHSATAIPLGRAAYSGLENAHAVLRAQLEEVEGSRDACVAHYGTELQGGESSIAPVHGGCIWVPHLTS
jgi:hypothetical protein